MPNKKEKAKPEGNIVGPSPSIIQKLLGGPINIARNWPELEQSLAGRQVEMPNESAKLNLVSEMGPFSRWRYPDASAVTGPFGNIALNRKLIEKEGQNIDDVLVHELTHVGQGKKGFLRKFFNPSAVEEEAVNKEGLRKVRRGDIPLR